MKRHSSKSRPTTELKTIGVAPLAIARGAATNLVRHVQQAVDLVQAVRSRVKSVSVVTEPMHIDVQPRLINEAAVVRLAVGLNEVALLGGVQLRQVDNHMTLSMNVDAYLVDRLALPVAGKLLSQASCRFNTQLQVELHQTIDSSAAPVRRTKSRPLLES